MNFAYPMPPTPAQLQRIQARYLLLQGSTPVFVDNNGNRYLDELWAIDARAHVAHLARFSIASPLVPVNARSPSMTSIDADPVLSAITFVPLPHSRSRLAALAHLPRTLARLWKAIGQTDVVHVGIAGWPYPLGWLGVPIARTRGKRVIVVVESAPWRGASGIKASCSKRVQGWVYETLGRAIVHHADVSFFTSRQYRQSLGKANGANEHVVEATWIPQDQIIAEEDRIALAHAPRSTDSAELRLAFFGRLTAEKGITFLVEAVGCLPSGASVSLDVYGEGPELPALQKTLSSYPRMTAIRLRGTLAYGGDLFMRIRDYDYVVVPNLGDEQPRIVYDAFSQGVPVLASATPGLRQCVAEASTGFFFGIADAEDLQRLILRLCEPGMKEARQQMTAQCVQLARSMTHDEMHRKRARIIGDFLRL